MPPATTSHQSDLLEVIAGRRSQARMRALLAVGLVLGFGAITGWTWAFVWFGVYATLQLVEYFLLGRRQLSQSAAMALLFTNTAVFGVFAMAGPMRDGLIGLACWVCLLCGAQLNSALTSQKSRLAFLASSTPLAIYLALTPVAALMLGAQLHQALALAGAAALIVVFTFMIWQAAARALQAESAARAQAEAADAAKSAFVAMVSHELRTPISAILAGAAEAKTAPFDLRQLVLETVRFWAPSARSRELAFRLEGAHSLPGWVEGDPTRIRQILNNLLSNALKFTETGSITLRLSAKAGDDGLRDLEFDVIDTGPGMSAEQRERLFVAYGQADDSVARTHGGTGLGLSISRELARLMGGDLTAASAPGQGAVFSLALGVRAVAAPAAVEPHDQDQTGLSVLIVDDHEINRRAFTLILQGAVDRIVTAVDGQAGLDALAQERFDVVLMDLNMPRMNGIDTVSALRARPGPNRQTPVIALTASAAPTEVKACLAAGMNAFVMKPVEAAQLFKAIEAVLETAEAASAVA